MRVLGTALATALGLAGHSAAAQDMFELFDGKGYAGLKAGVGLVEDIDVNATVDGTIRISGSGSIEIDNALIVGGVAGYRFNDWLTGEVEAVYGQADYDAISGSATVSNGGTSVTFDGTAPIDGELSALSGLVNVYLTPPVDDTGTWQPYIGGGIGMMSYEDDIATIDGVAVNLSDDATELVWQFKAGIDFAMTPQWWVGVEYAYVGAETGTSFTEDFAMHAFTARAVFKF